MSNWVKTILFLIGSAVLTHWIPSSFRNLDTMVHEFGHAVMTLALSGHVQRIELYANHSGVTLSSISSSRWWSFIPISLAGYMTASLFAWFLFSAYARGKKQIGFYVMMIVSAISLLLFVRNGFGMTFLVGFIAVTVIVMTFTPKWLSDFYYLLLAFYVWKNRSLGRFIWYSLRRAMHAKQDAANLANSTGIPAIVWAIGFTLFALWCAKQAVSAFLGRSKRARRASQSTTVSSFRD